MDAVELLIVSAISAVLILWFGFISGVKYETARFLYLIKSFSVAAKRLPAARFLYSQSTRSRCSSAHFVGDACSR
jgi:hypothetical protein